MELKSSFGKYRVKDVKAYLEALASEHEAELTVLQTEVFNLKKEKEELEAQVADYKAKEAAIAKTMLDATEHARQIEDDYRQRAQDSDKACQQLHDEWVTGIRSAQANLEKLRGDAQKLLSSIDGQFSSLCSWADTRLTSLEKAQLPTPGEKTLEKEIAEGAGADLAAACRDLGLNVDEAALAAAREALNTPDEKA